MKNKEKDFYKKYSHGEEITYCSHTQKMQYQHYAARFAAKEAVFKAISSKLPNGIGDVWTKIEVQNDSKCKPVVNLEKLNLKNIVSMDLSLSHIEEYAVASFTILFN